jgi:beta-phosphoglucomutase
LRAVIFDVDGVLVDSPHFRAWGDAIEAVLPSASWTLGDYQEYVAGMPRLAGARAVLGRYRVPDPDDSLAQRLADRKQEKFAALIAAGEFRMYGDAVTLVLLAKARGMLVAAASSSKNANAMLAQIPLVNAHFPNLLAAFDANVCGLDVPRGKPAPDLFLAAAYRLGVPPAECVVVEDAPSGVAAAKAAGMACIGVARLDDAELLRKAGADWVVRTLDEVEPGKL